MKLTDLELKILLRVAQGEDPWNGNRTWHTRIISQTLGRLERKGAIIRIGGYSLTESAKLYLTGVHLAGKISAPKA